jgi:hypothetical protein
MELPIVTFPPGHGDADFETATSLALLLGAAELHVVWTGEAGPPANRPAPLTDRTSRGGQEQGPSWLGTLLGRLGRRSAAP